MKAQAISSLIIIMTLVIGMILGGLFSGFLRGDMPRRPPGGQNQGKFEMMLNQIVKPNDSQKVEFDRITMSYSSKFNEQHQQHTVEMKVLMDSLIDDLSPILTEEQLTGLTERLERMDRRSRGFRGRGKRGRPPEPGHPVEPGHPPEQEDTPESIDN